ncbi:alpha/beta hydrolase [Spirosoma sp. SC4-14]|uniref:alpha/beta hydrolase n=1 Tax=Spirosoma sp. SC4-14 TaxID=3128900 RepID=UPI0030D43C69
MTTTNQTDASTAVESKAVTFKSNGLRIAGMLYLPADFRASAQPRPAIVVGHPGAGVKEQTAGLYAGLLANNGYVALAFDAAYQGESEGLPRNYEDPTQRIEDIKAAVTFLASMPEIDANRIGVLGICASGGYGVAATATDHRIKVLATVCAAGIGHQFRQGGDGLQSPQVIQALLEQAAADRCEVDNGKEPGEFSIFPPTAELAKALGQHVYEGWEYYCTDRGYHLRSAKTFTWKSVELVAGFDAFRFANLIAPRPLLMIAGSEAKTLWMTQEAIKTAQEPKELFMIDGATHVDLYDKMEFVTPAITKLLAFYTTTL